MVKGVKEGEAKQWKSCKRDSQPSTTQLPELL